ncbi:MAG: nitrate- and nitrite sensing domain-containing protein [Thermodesulfobacteriota bacterium]
MNFVGQMPLKTQIRLLVAIPLFFLVGLTLLNGIGKYQTLSRATSLKELAAIAGMVTEIAHEAQKERGMTAGFLGSQGQKFRDRLPGQRAETDKRLDTLRQFLAISTADKNDGDLAKKLAAALAAAEGRASIRQQADGLTISGPDAIAFYTGMIREFLTTIPIIARTSPDKETAQALIAYYNFVEAKERMGIERAVLSNTFAADSFAPGMYKRLAEILAAQKLFLDSFAAFASPAAIAFYEEKMRAPVVAQVAAMEKTALDRYAEGGFGVDATQWFDAITEKINLMKEVESWLAADAVALATKTIGAARTALVATTVTALAVIALSLLLAVFLSSRIGKALEHISEDLTNGAHEVNAAASQVSSVSQSLADGAGNQAAAIEETSASLEEISAVTKQNADNVGRAETLTREARTMIETANGAMGRLTVSMAEISQASDETSKIVKTIDEIAFQTNLLALNAAVEAARAGEAGAGFAVVANEVRNLAMRAAEAAKNTAQLIEGTVQKVQGGATLVTTTNDSFQEVADNTAKIALLMQELASASREQASGVQQVNLAVTELDTVTQHNAATAEEAASAAEELNAQAGQMQETVRVLTALVRGAGRG